MQEKIIHTLEGKPLLLQPVESGYELLLLSEIYHITIDNGYTFIRLSNKKEIIISQSLKNYESLLMPYKFYRVSRNDMVNLSYIKYIKHDQVILTDGSNVHLSVRQRRYLLRELRKI